MHVCMSMCVRAQGLVVVVVVVVGGGVRVCVCVCVCVYDVRWCACVMYGGVRIVSGECQCKGPRSTA